MDNPFIITANGTITFDCAVLITRLVFERTATDKGTPIKLLSPLGSIISQFTGSLTVNLDREGLHEDLIPHWFGIYEVIGLLPGDTLSIYWKMPTPKPEPVVPTETEIAQGRIAYCNEQSRRRAHHATNLSNNHQPNRVCLEL